MASDRHRLNAFGLIPAPLYWEHWEGTFPIQRATAVRVNLLATDTIRIGEELARRIRQATGFPCPVEPAPEISPAAGAILLARGVGPEMLGSEGYDLQIRRNGIILLAPTAAGLFYGIQTLRQLLPPESEGGPPGAGGILELPCLRVVDRPRFPWRGLLLDSCRHFISLEKILSTIDRMAFFKMNRFHWHLTEDQGWRIPIQAYPRLTEVGAWRTREDGQRHGGFYSPEEIRRVVDHAAERYVEVIPEIELPGHCSAALAAYPELSCTGQPRPVPSTWGIFEDVYCAGQEEVFTFLERVLEEVFQLFPGPYIHLGADEVPKTRWRICPRCQARIRAQGLSSEEELQAWFIQRISRFVREHGRRGIAWDEVREGGLPPEMIVQAWRSMDAAVESARLGASTIVSPTSHAYLDYGLDRIDLERVYSFDPIPPELDRKERLHILGGECNLWTERIPEADLDRRLYPRLLAMAERLWSSSDRREFDEFRRRVRHLYPRLDRMGIRPGPETVKEPDGPIS